jgi:hypothetical protein
MGGSHIERFGAALHRQGQPTRRNQAEATEKRCRIGGQLVRIGDDASGQVVDRVCRQGQRKQQSTGLRVIARFILGNVANVPCILGRIAVAIMPDPVGGAVSSGASAQQIGVLQRGLDKVDVRRSGLGDVAIPAGTGSPRGAGCRIRLVGQPDPACRVPGQFPHRTS